MAEEETPETTEQPEPAEEPQAEAPQEAAEAPAAEPEAVETPAAEPEAAEVPAAEAEAAPAVASEPGAPPLSPKERRRRDRAGGAARASRSPEERQAERDAARAQNAAERRRHRTKQHERHRAAAGAPVADIAPVEHAVGNPKVRQGIVISDKADKTITVRIDVARRHRRYRKIVRSSTMLHAHDERNEAHEGDTVRVVESRPISRLKRWRLVEVLERAK
jgi:small subunit ribosomal protein S17